MTDYNFNPEEIYNSIKIQWLNFMNNLKTNKIVLGISGGKDSTVTAVLGARIFGKDNVYGVVMPRDGKQDIEDTNEVFKISGINRIDIDIGDAYNSLINGVENNGIEITSDTLINLGPRLRMSTLYAVAQSVNGVVLNTDNIGELIAGYFTIFGDGAGSYGPLRELTVPEVIELGRYLGIPERLITKKPGDGLQPLGDEDRIGMTYLEIHNFIRKHEFTKELYDKLTDRYFKNKFKTDIVNIPCPKLNLPNWLSVI